MTTEPNAENIRRRKQLSERTCRLMGWQFNPAAYDLLPEAWTRVRAGESVALLSLDELEAMLDRLDLVAELVERLRFFYDFSEPPVNIHRYKLQWDAQSEATLALLQRLEPLLESKQPPS